jgi:hypothetical protein
MIDPGVGIFLGMRMFLSVGIFIGGLSWRIFALRQLPGGFFCLRFL